MARVLLTGASGFVGSHVHNSLKERGYEVIGICNKTTYPGLIPFDLLNNPYTEDLIKDVKADFLIHTAWYVEQDYKDSIENLNWLSKSIDLVKYFYKNGGQRAMTLGSCFEYSFNSPCRENNGLGLSEIPNTLYGTTKLALYNTLKKYADVNHLSYVHPRLFYLFGPHESPTRLVPSVARNLLSNQIVECLSPDHIRDFLYVEDAASTLATILGYPAVTETINVGSGKERSIRTVTKFIETYLHKIDKIQYGNVYKDEDPMVILGDLSKLNSQVMPQFEYTFESGLAKTLDWIRDNYKEVRDNG